MSKTQVKAMIAIFAASLLSQSINTMSLLINGVMAAYPGTGVTQAQLIISVANLIALVGMLIVGKMANFMTKKSILLIFLCVMAIGGLMGYFCTPNLTMLYVACGVFGLGNGALFPLTSGLIAEHFEGGQRATVMGSQSIFVNGGGVLLNLAGGFVAAMFWKGVFLIYLASLVIAVIVLVLLPKGEVERAPENADEGPAEKPKVFTKFVAVLMFQGLFIGMCFMTFMSNVTLDIVELGIGNEAQAGIVTMITSLGAVIGGVLIAFIMRACKRYIFAAAMTIGALALWVSAFAGSLPVLIVGAFLLGVAFTMHNTSYYTLAPSNASPATTTMTMSLYTVAMQAGTIICPIVITPLATALLGPAVSNAFVLGAAITTVVAVITWFMPKVLSDYKLTLD